jgi:outer membrane receptor for ferrienterochelin and colicins
MLSHANSKNGLLLASVGLVFQLTSQPSFADNEKVSSELDGIVVTSSKEARFLKEVPVRTEVITAEEIAKKHATNLAEALKNLPGIQLKEIHGKAGQSVWMQGFDSDRVLILVDGNPLPASTGSTVDLTQISVAGVARVEIIKGAASALYGTSAMGGVINVITEKTPQTPQLNLDLQAGSWQEQDIKRTPLARHILTIAASDRQGPWETQFNAKLDHSNGWKVDPNQESTQGESGQRNNLSGLLGYQSASTAALLP